MQTEPTPTVFFFYFFSIFKFWFWFVSFFFRKTKTILLPMFQNQSVLLHIDYTILNIVFTIFSLTALKLRG